MKTVLDLENENDFVAFEKILMQSHTRTYQLSRNSIHSIIDVLVSVGKLWKVGGLNYLTALEHLNFNTGFSDSMNRMSLAIIPKLLSRKSLYARVKAEFKNIDCLDGFLSIDDYKGRLFYAPKGTLLHVTAGNVFLGCIDSIVMGCLTKNTSLIKLSSQNKYLPGLFMQSLIEADSDSLLTPNVLLLAWKGGNQKIEERLKSQVDCIIAWGGEKMVENYSKNLPPRVDLISHGPKISFQVLSKDFICRSKDDLYSQLAQDILMWDQSACSNAQNIFLEEGVDVNLFNEKLAMALAAAKYPRGVKSGDEYVELLKDYQEGLYQEFETGYKTFLGGDFQIQFDHEYLTPCALNRSVKVKTFKNSFELSQMLREFSFYLQTCALGATYNERASYQKDLSLAGVNRIVEPGKMLSMLDGSPHDGNLPLVELTRMTADEASESFQDLIDSIDAPFYQDYKGVEFHKLPLVDGDTFNQHSIIKDSAFLSPKASSGYVYSSGGTTGDPKFCFYSYEEFNHVAQMLGQAYHEMGVREGVRVANLFMAGNMWSSFNAVQAGLRYCKSIQYPIGGLVNAKDFKYYIKNFKIKIVFGLPSLLLDLANKVPDLEIDQIFYAGEAFSKDGEDFIKSVWKVKSFHSAGYASVDVGPIGYQTLDCHDGEHYLFDDQLHLEVVDDEAIITSKVRKMMPVIRYRTGDRVEIIEKTNGRTKFKLLGRVDKKVNIWSSRFEMNDLKKLMQQMDYHGQFQIQLKSTTVENNYKDLMCLVLSEPMAITPAEFLEQFYLSMHDVAQTHAVKFLEDKLILSYGDFYINKRTGKFKDLIDFR